MQRTRLKVGCDYDDLLAFCNEVVVEKYNAENGTSYTLEEFFKKWNQKDEFLDFKLQCYNDPEFVKNQPLYPGAKEFIKTLSQKCEVFITSAVPPQCMSARAMQVIENFPDIKQDHIILGATKSLYDLDVIFDDGSHNIRTSIAKFPVLMRRPWNSDLSGVLSVNNYDDFLHIIDIINESYLNPDLSDGGVICLVGPSGSGKTAIMSELIKDQNYAKPLTTTTRAKREGEPADAYRFVSKEEFLKEKADGAFLETTLYSGNYYGTKFGEIENIVMSKKYAVIPIDICGAISIKNKYRQKALIIFVNRGKDKVISEIVGRNVSNAEKTRRILSLDNEYQNEVFADRTIDNNLPLKRVVKKVQNIIKEVA